MNSFETFYHRKKRKEGGQSRAKTEKAVCCPFSSTRSDIDSIILTHVTHNLFLHRENFICTDVSFNPFSTVLLLPSVQ